MNTNNLITIPQYIKEFIGKRGKPVTVPYIYKLIRDKKLKVVKIAGKQFIERGTKPE